MNHKRAVKKLMGIGIKRNDANFCLRTMTAGKISNAESVSMARIMLNKEPSGPIISTGAWLRHIVEMICDWLSFAIGKGDLHELFNWYKENFIKMIFWC